MSSSPETPPLEATSEVPLVGIAFDRDTMLARFEDGRTVDLPLTMFPRLMHGTAEERSRWRLVGSGIGVHWPDLDEDLSSAGILARKPSMESDRSFHRWLEKRTVQQAST